MLFIFRGTPNYRTQKYFYKKDFKQTCMVMIFLICPVLGIPSILAGIYFSIWFFSWFSLACIIGSVVVMKMTQRAQLCTRIAIDEREVLVENHEGACATRSVEDIKKVVDHGEFYEIIFYWGIRFGDCVCQKDLIIEGTIEEFEEMFKDKIERKYEINK